MLDSLVSIILKEVDYMNKNIIIIVFLNIMFLTSCNYIKTVTDFKTDIIETPIINKEDTSIAVTTEKAEKTSEKICETSEAEEIKPINYYVGDTVPVSYGSVTVKEYYSAMGYVDHHNRSVSPNEGNIFIVVSAPFINEGTESISLYDTELINNKATLIYDDTYMYDSVYIKRDLESLTIQPLQTVNRLLIFEVPETVWNSSGTLKLSLTEGYITVNYMLR